jgi:hypothetical protein
MSAAACTRECAPGPWGPCVEPVHWRGGPRGSLRGAEPDLRLRRDHRGGYVRVLVYPRGNAPAGRTQPDQLLTQTEKPPP